MINEIKNFIDAYIEDNKAEYIKIEKKIWETPELGMEEYYASGLLTELLESNGFVVEKGVAQMPTAFIATYGSERPTIGFSMEYDALPGLSQKVSTEKCAVREGAPGQGCGHNLIGTGGALAATAFKAAIEKFDLKASIKIFGTPAEELCIGKPVMGNAGLFKGTDAIIDWHPWYDSNANYKQTPAYFNVKFHYKGYTAHGNSPWHGRSALDAAILQANAIEMLREHITPGNGQAAANTINYTFSNTGPEFASVVPDKASLWCIGRFATSDELSDILVRLENTAKGAALATGVTVETEYITACHEMITNSVIAEVLYKNLCEAGNVAFTPEEKQFVMDMQKAEGQEPYWSDKILDFDHMYFPVTDSSEYSWEAPYALLALNLGPGPSWHNWMVASCNGNSHGEKCMLKAASVLARSAVDLATDLSIIEKAQKERLEHLNGREYKGLLPEGTPIPLNISKANMDKYRD